MHRGGEYPVTYLPTCVQHHPLKRPKVLVRVLGQERRPTGDNVASGNADRGKVGSSSRGNPVSGNAAIGNAGSGNADSDQTGSSSLDNPGSRNTALCNAVSDNAVSGNADSTTVGFFSRGTPGSGNGAIGNADSGNANSSKAGSSSKGGCGSGHATSGNAGSRKADSGVTYSARCHSKSPGVSSKRPPGGDEQASLAEGEHTSPGDGAGSGKAALSLVHSGSGSGAAYSGNTTGSLPLEVETGAAGSLLSVETGAALLWAGHGRAYCLWACLLPMGAVILVLTVKS
ncbi:UNVERIFIED_CONTAM: hypothetical protein FKN15_072752 [Acipenser sinensis]